MKDYDHDDAATDFDIETALTWAAVGTLCAFAGLVCAAVYLALRWYP